MNNLSIKSKVLLITIVPVFLTASLLSFYFVKERLKDTEMALQEKGDTIIRYLAPALEYGLISGNREYIDALVHNTLSIPEVAAIRVRDAEQRLLMEQAGDTPADAAEANLVFRSVIYRSEIPIDDLDNDGGSGNSGQRETLGTLVLELSRAGILQTRQQIVRNGVLITFLSLLVTTILALYFSRTVVLPINLLTRGIHRIRDGILGERIHTGAGGEIAVLEVGINNMSASLQLARMREKARTEDTLFIERSKAQITLEAIGEGVITTDVQGMISYLNPAAENLLGIRLEYVRGRHLHEVFRLQDMAERKPLHYPMERCLEEGRPIRHDDPVILLGRDGTEFIIRDNATPLRSRSGEITGMVLIFHDFTHIQRISDQLTFQATHDELTGLHNRREFESRLKALLSDSNFETQVHALCFLDLDQFKIVNDTCGHVAGDALLKDVARLLLAQVRRNDLVARLGGDEFGIILFNCPLKQALIVAESIRDAIRQHRCTWEEHVFEIGVSIGLVPIDSMALSPAEIMINADTACYIAKDSGKNRVHVYQPTDHDFLRRHDEIRWLRKINRALDAENFELYCQPIVPIEAADAPCKYEILLRLRDEAGLMSPADFLPAAEHYSLMPDIDRWVMQAFVAMLERTGGDRFAGRSHLFSINISGQSLCNDDFLDFLIHLFETRNIDPALITFEITETAAIDNHEAALNLIEGLRKLGCTFALDDFGSGLSSLRYLKELPVDYLKIDGHFVQNIETSEVNQSIIAAVTGIARALKLETIAEFVETEEAREVLRRYGIDYIQGWVIGMPRPLKDVLAEMAE